VCASLAWFPFYCRLHATGVFSAPLCERSTTVAGLFSEADDALFRRILYNKTHVLHTYLPERPHILYSLRTRAHNKSLICKTSDLNERNLSGACIKIVINYSHLSECLLVLLLILILILIFFLNHTWNSAMQLQRSTENVDGHCKSVQWQSNSH